MVTQSTMVASGIAPVPAMKPPQPAPYDPAARDAALRSLGSPAKPAVMPAPQPVVGAPQAASQGFAATDHPQPGIMTMTGAAPGATAATPAADHESWMAAQPDQNAFIQSFRTAAPDARQALISDFMTKMQTWVANHPQPHMPDADQNFSDAFDHFENADRRERRHPDQPQVSDDEAARMEGLRIKRLRKSRLGQ